MSDTDGRRRLAAILAADAAGYSRLMTADEDATVVALDAARSVFKLRVEGNQGRIIDMAGDSVLAVFETAIGAVSAALAIQAELESKADATRQNRRMRFRIGIHLGDVIEKADGTVYGDGVNTAARLQALAEPGSVTVSGIVYEAVRDRVAAGFEDCGEHVVKNILRPVHAYRIESRAPGDAAPRAEKPVPRERRPRWRMLTPIALVLAVSMAAWMASVDSSKTLLDRLATLVGGNTLQRSSARTSIAVMPFSNQSGNAKRDYFSDGITEDLINALGRISGLSVTSRNAVQVFKGRSVTPTEIGSDLGVRYIVQGSVRQAGDRVRVVVELSEAQTGAQLWSDRYEDAGAQVFEMQDHIVSNIVGALAVKLTRVEQQRVFSKPTDSLEAYDLVLRARGLIERSERSANGEARSLLARAEKLAPRYAEIFTALAEAEMQSALYGWIEDPAEGMTRAEEQCKRALASDDQRAHARAHALLAAVYSHQDRFEEALSHTKRAIELNPSDATALYRHGASLLYLGHIKEAIAAMETAKRFEPQPSAGTRLNLAVAYYLAGRYREALVEANAAPTRTPHDLVMMSAVRAATLAQLGDADAARQAAAQVRRFSPLFDVESFGTRFTNPAHTAVLQDGLRRAGL